MNLRHPFLIYGLCKKARVPLEMNETWIHLIKVIIVKKNKSSVPRPKGAYDSENEPLDEEKLRAYQDMYGGDMTKEEKWDNLLPNLYHPQPKRRTIPCLLTLLRITYSPY